MSFQHISFLSSIISAAKYFIYMSEISKMRNHWFQSSNQSFLAKISETCQRNLKTRWRTLNALEI